MAAASYEWAVSADGEDWSVVETEDDETFGVTADLLGMYVKVTVTAEDGETASDVTTEKVAENEDYGKIEILSAEAVATNKVEVTLVNPVISTDTTIAITRGTTEITISKTSWESTFDKVTLTTDANMVPGAYKVTLTSEEDETNTDSDTFEVEAQEINIVILNETALTNVDEAIPANSHKEAYAYYDVLDQYGESIRTSTSITWAGSCNITPDKATGRLTLEKSDGNAWVYGDKIYVTGVHTKTGASATAELSVGQEQALDSIEVAGFVKKNTTELKKTLPADFKTGEWYLLFNAYDQNGNLIQAGGLKDTDVSIISDNVLVVSAVKGVQNAPITIDDIEYNAIIVEPGIKVSDGGAVTLTAIALRTGTKTTYDCIVGVGTVITSFTMGTPAGIVADGDSVEIPYTALDEDGNTVTDFVTLAKNKTFNALSFSVGGNGALVLAEQEDGSAKLTYVDEDIAWEDSRSTDGIDRPVSLTAIVVGGETDNQLLSVQDKRRPDAIKDVDLDDVYVEGAEIGLSLADITFYDQYNEVMDDGDALDFFDTTTFAGGRDFAGYNFTVKATYSGNGGLYVGATHPFATPADTVLTSGDGWMLSNSNTIGNLGFEGLTGINNPTVYAKEDVTASVTNEGFKFEIVKVATAQIADPEKYETVSRSKSKLFTIVDIKAIKNFTVGDLGTLYVGAGAATGDGKIAHSLLDELTELNTPTAFAVTAAGEKGIGVTAANNYKKAVKLTGTYNGKDVTIPTQYYTATGNKVASSAVNDGTHTAVKLDTVIGYDPGDAPNGLTLQDLYDKTTPLGVAQLGSDKIQATVWDIYGERLDGTTDTVADVVDDTEITTLKAADDTDLTTPTTLTAADLTEDIDWAGTTINTAIADIDARTAVLDGILANSSAYETLGSGNNVDLHTAAEAAATAEKAELAALKTKLEASIAVNTVDTASTTVSLSDQKPTATSFKNFDDTYTWSPVGTEYGEGTLYTYIDAALVDSEVAVLDQYGIDMGVTPDQIDKKASNIEENEDGYVENNFTTTGNNTPDLTIVGAERGDTWTLTLSYDKLEQSSEITVGADAWATIVNANNIYLTAAFDDDGDQISGLQPKLENQRKAILDIA